MTNTLLPTELTDGGAAPTAALEALLHVSLAPAAGLSGAQHRRVGPPLDVG